MTESELNMIACVRLWRAEKDADVGDLTATIAAIRDLPEAELRPEYERAMIFWAQRLIAKNKQKDGIETLYSDGTFSLDRSRVPLPVHELFRVRVGEATPEHPGLYFDAATARGIAFALVHELGITPADLFPRMASELRLQIMQEMITALDDTAKGQ